MLASIASSFFGGDSEHHRAHSEAVANKSKPASPGEVSPPAPTNGASAPAAKGQVSVQIDATGVHIRAQDPKGEVAQLQIDEQVKVIDE